MLEANFDRKMCQNKNRRDVVLDQKLEEIVEMRFDGCSSAKAENVKKTY